MQAKLVLKISSKRVFEICRGLERDEPLRAVRLRSGRQIKINVEKAQKAWWPRLTSGPKPANVKIDWATWKDEDEGVSLISRAVALHAL